MTRTWRTDSYGRVRVTDDGIEWMPFPSAASQNALEDGIAKWGTLFSDEVAKSPVAQAPIGALTYTRLMAWLFAMAKRESGFHERARNNEGTPENPRDDGIGLFQITSRQLKGNYTDEELFDPALNTRVAIAYILALVHLYGTDFPRISAAFNAGSPRPDPKSPWNLHATGNHIDEEVESLNHVLSRRAPMVEAPPVPDTLPSGPHA